MGLPNTKSGCRPFIGRLAFDFGLLALLALVDAVLSIVTIGSSSVGSSCKKALLA